MIPMILISLLHLQGLSSTTSHWRTSRWIRKVKRRGEDDNNNDNNSNRYRDESATEEEEVVEESDEDNDRLSLQILKSWRVRKNKIDSDFTISAWGCDTYLKMREDVTKRLNDSLLTKIESFMKKLFADLVDTDMKKIDKFRGDHKVFMI